MQLILLRLVQPHVAQHATNAPSVPLTMPTSCAPALSSQQQHSTSSFLIYSFQNYTDRPMANNFRPTISRAWSEPDCHVCKRMAETKRHSQEGGCAVCLLCNRPFCERHKGEEVDVCEINHFTYFRNHQHLLYSGTRNIFPTMKSRWEALGGEPNRSEEEDKGAAKGDQKSDV